MAISVAGPAAWEEIERAESYLVCCMFEEAAVLASSIVKRLLESKRVSEYGEEEWDDMLESAGMVFVQSVKQLQRTSEILEELRVLFGSVIGVPVQIFITAVCYQMSKGSLTIAQEFLEEFVNKWRYVDGRYYPVSSVEANASDMEELGYQLSLAVDQYLEVVELYVVTLLSVTMGNIDQAVCWVEKATLPAEKHQELLRRLNSINSSKVTSSSPASVSPVEVDEFKTKSGTLNEDVLYNGYLKESSCTSSERNSTKQSILKLSRREVPCFRWFPSIRLKFGNNQITIAGGKILLACSLLLVYYFIRKKGATLKRTIRKQVSSIGKALVDLWQLAFSYQVNPLAAVQSLPIASHGSQ